MTHVLCFRFGHCPLLLCCLLITSPPTPRSVRDNCYLLIIPSHPLIGWGENSYDDVSLSPWLRFVFIIQRDSLGCVTVFGWASISAGEDKAKFGAALTEIKRSKCWFWVIYWEWGSFWAHGHSCAVTICSMVCGYHPEKDRLSVFSPGIFSAVVLLCPYPQERVTLKLHTSMEKQLRNTLESEKLLTLFLSNINSNRNRIIRKGKWLEFWMICSYLSTWRECSCRFILCPSDIRHVHSNPVGLMAVNQVSLEF